MQPFSYGWNDNNARKFLDRTTLRAQQICHNSRKRKGLQEMEVERIFPVIIVRARQR